MTKKDLIKEALQKGEGVLRLVPNWVPRIFSIPGKRLKLDPRDYYALGAHRGGIDERWFASTVKADNGPETPEDEGLSYIFIEKGTHGEKVLLKEAIDIIGDEILGKETMEKEGGWVMFAKFFDNMDPLPLHMHQSDELAKKVGMKGKPEAYYFPKQLNNHPGYFPLTYFGLEPGTTKEDIKKCIENWNKGDNGILNYSKAYRLELGTGWYVPPGVLHAPGSLLTYEPQRSSDVYAMFQSLVWDKFIDKKYLVNNVPENHKEDLDYIVDMLDWKINLDPEFKKHYHRKPKPIKDIEEMREEGYEEYWIAYGSPYFSAKELTVLPKRKVLIKEPSAYGVIVIQGHGMFERLSISSPTLIRFGQMTEDELFVSYDRAKEGVWIENTSNTEKLVMLKHFGPDNHEAPLK